MNIFHKIVENKGNLGNYVSPWQAKPYTTLHNELEFEQPFKEKFIETIKAFNADDLTNLEIVRSKKGQRRKLGDYLQGLAYHELVHTGQMLSYLRALGLERPQI